MHRVVTVLSVLIAGCISHADKAWFERTDNAGPSLLTRASFDLDCPRDGLQVTPLGVESDNYLTVGVKGCERAATYVFHSGNWVMNSTRPRETTTSVR